MLPDLLIAQPEVGFIIHGFCVADEGQSAACSLAEGAGGILAESVITFENLLLAPEGARRLCSLHF